MGKQVNLHANNKGHQQADHKWVAPCGSQIEINIDASVRTSSFSIGMVLTNNLGGFCGTRVYCHEVK